MYHEFVWGVEVGWCSLLFHSHMCDRQSSTLSATGLLTTWTDNLLISYLCWQVLYSTCLKYIHTKYYTVLGLRQTLYITFLSNLFISNFHSYFKGDCVLLIVKLMTVRECFQTTAPTPKCSKLFKMANEFVLLVNHTGVAIC